MNRVMPESTLKAPSLSRGSTAGSVADRLRFRRASARSVNSPAPANDAALGLVMNPMADYTTAPSGPRVNGGAGHPLNGRAAAGGGRGSKESAAGGGGGGGGAAYGGAAAVGGAAYGGAAAAAAGQHRTHWEQPRPSSPAGAKDPPVHPPGRRSPHHHSAAPAESSLRDPMASKYQRPHPHPQPIPAGQGGGQGQQLRGLTLTETGGVELPLGLDRSGTDGTYGQTSAFGADDTLGGVETIGTKEDGGHGGGGWKQALPWNLRKDRHHHQHEGGAEREQGIQHPYHTTAAPGGGAPHRGAPLATPPLGEEEDDGTGMYTIEHMMDAKRREAREHEWKERMSEQAASAEDGGGHGRHHHKKHHHRRDHHDDAIQSEQRHRGHHSHAAAGGGDLHPLHRDSHAQRQPFDHHHHKKKGHAGHSRESSKDGSVDSGSAVTPAPNLKYYEKESAWMDRLAEKRTEEGYDAGFGASAAAAAAGQQAAAQQAASGRRSPSQYASTYGEALTEATYEDRFLPGQAAKAPAGRRHSPSGRYSPTRGQSHSPSRAPLTSYFGSHSGDVIPGLGSGSSSSPKPYSSGEKHPVDSRFAHGGMTPEQFDAYQKAQERNNRTGGTVANPRLAALSEAGPAPALSPEDALHFGGGMGGMDNRLDPYGVGSPSGRHIRGTGARSSVGSVERSSVTSSTVPSEVAHAGMTPEQLDAYRKAQEQTRKESGTAANARLAALAEQQKWEVKSTLKEDSPIRQGRVVPVWESRRNNGDDNEPLDAEVEPAPSPAPAPVAKEQVEAYEKARAEAQRAGGTSANPRLDALSSGAGGGGGVAREQVEAYEKAQARARVGAAAVANPRLAALSEGGGGAGMVAQEQVDAYAKAQARADVRGAVVAQEQVDAYEKARAQGMGAAHVPSTPGAHPLERTHWGRPPQPGTAAHTPSIPLSAAGGPPSVASADRHSPFVRRAEDGEYDVPRRREGVDEDLMARHLVENGFTSGLASALVRRCASCPLRVWLVDNSGSMLGTDGHRVVQDARTAGRVNTVDCTRWEEVSSTVTWHAQMCAVLRAPIVFRMLNDPGRPFPQQMSVAERSGQQNRGDTDEAAEQQLLAGEVHLVRETFRRTRPSGGSNLSRHLRAIHDSVSGMADDLRRDGQRVAVVVVTDGLPTDDYGSESADANDEFLDVLRKFAGLPVWVVMRLSTDEQRVIDFYNNVDTYFTELGPDLTVDVLDDFVGEANEVRRSNPWLNYALPLHLCRESGMHFAVFDAVDERPLSPAELRDLCGILFDRRGGGGDAAKQPFPNPDVDWAAFSAELRRAVDREREQWDPVKERVAPWIDFPELDRIYGGGARAAGARGAAARASAAGGGLGGGGGAETGGKKQGCACVIQ